MSDSQHYWPSPSSSPTAPLAQHDILTVVRSKINDRVVQYIVERIADTVAHGLGRPSNKSIPEGNDPFPVFVQKVFRRADVSMSVVTGALVYIERARSHLKIAIEEWALHRVFLGSLILAAKYLNDSSLKNAHWALCTRLFGKRDIARVEREFLDVLNWNLAVKEEDVAQCAARLVASGCIDLLNPSLKQPLHQRVVAAETSAERRSRSEERHAHHHHPLHQQLTVPLQHRVQAPLPSRAAARSLSSASSAPALLVPPMRPQTSSSQQYRYPATRSRLSPHALHSSSSSRRTASREDEDTDDSENFDSPASSTSCSSSDDSGHGDSPFTPEHISALGSAFPYPPQAPHAVVLPKLVLPPPPPMPTRLMPHPHHHHHKRAPAHARIAPYPPLSSLPSSRTASPASAYAYAVPAPPLSATASASAALMGKVPLVLPPPASAHLNAGLGVVQGLYPSCIGPYPS